MGNCTSCVGGSYKDVYEEHSESQVLIEDGGNLGYGSLGDQQLGTQIDAREGQRETEALQRVVAQTSNNMIDVFEIVPHDDASRPTVGGPSQYGFVGQDAQSARYKQLLSRLSATDEGLATIGYTADPVPPTEADPFEKQRKMPSLRLVADEPLVGTFSDARLAVS